MYDFHRITPFFLTSREGGGERIKRLPLRKNNFLRDLKKFVEKFLPAIKLGWGGGKALMTLPLRKSSFFAAHPISLYMYIVCYSYSIEHCLEIMNILKGRHT